MRIQIENEYGTLSKLYGAEGHSYLNWAANMAIGLNTQVPWIMCKQDNAPDPMVHRICLYTCLFDQISNVNCLFVVTEIIFVEFSDDRLTLAMDSTVISLRLIDLINPKCGLRLGLAGTLTAKSLTLIKTTSFFYVLCYEFGCVGFLNMVEV